MHKVFIVEDEEILREGMKKNINWEEAGYEFSETAKDGEEALTLIRKCMPDIIITDIKMPFMNGLEMSKIIKEENPSIKIIVLTGYDEFDFAREAISIGADEYLLKPFSAKKLLNSLNQISEKIIKEKEEKVLTYEKYILEKELLKTFENKGENIQEFYKNDNEIIEDFFKFGKLTEIDSFVNNYVKNLKESSINSYIYTYYIFMNLFMSTSKFLKNIGEVKLEDVFPEIKDIEFFCIETHNDNRLKEAIRDIFFKVINFRENHKTDKYGVIIEEAKSFIRKNLSNPDLSLNLVAYNIHVSPNHFSSIFKSSTGESFTDFLIKIRIEKAKELLNSTTLKTYEISEKIGYPDSHYFSYIFKKNTGLTPSEFKKKS